MACLWLTSPTAHAGSYSGPVYTSVGTDPGAPYGPVTGGYGGGGTDVRTCSGTITATFHWTADPNVPGDKAPQSVIVTQTSNANWSLLGFPDPGASCVDGLTDPEQDTVSQAQAPTYSGVSSGTHSMAKTPGANGDVVLTCTPSVSNPGATTMSNANVTYSATASPVTLSLTGTRPDASGNANILVGQGCGASVSGLPSGFTVSKYTWAVSGTTFQQWSPTTPALPPPPATPTTPANPSASYYVGGLGPANNSTAHWYWNDPNNTTETVKCTLNVVPPAGQGAPFSFFVTKKVNVQLPTWDGVGQGGYMQINALVPNQSDIQLWAGPTTDMKANGAKGGMNWQCHVHTPPTPAFGTGSMELIQLVTPSSSYTSLTTPAQTYNNPLNGVMGSDLTPPYGSCTEASQPYNDNDSPGLHITQTAHGVAGSATFQSSYVDYLMYLPPGGDCKWIALGTFSWSTNGSATIPTSKNWADYVHVTQNGPDDAGTVTPGSTAVTPFTGVIGPAFFPSWKTIDGKPSF